MNLVSLARVLFFVKYLSGCDLCYVRYQNRDWGFLGRNIEWDMVRAPAVDTPPYVVHVSHCSHNLKPEDHVEIQWRPDTQSPYGIILKLVKFNFIKQLFFFLYLRIEKVIPNGFTLFSL